MAMAMQAMDVSAVSLNAFQVSMKCTSRYGNARFKRIDSERILNELDARKIVIVTGFQGVNKYGDYATLSATEWTLVEHEFTLTEETTICLVVMSPKNSSYHTSQNILVDDASLVKVD